MTVFLVILAVVALLVVSLMLSNFGKNPSSKTASQLERELILHDQVLASTNSASNSYSERLSRKNAVEAELQKRQTVGAVPSQPSEANISADEIRNKVTTGFNEGLQRAQLEGKDNAKVLEAALVGGLLNRLVGVDGWSSVGPIVIKATMMEILPFKHVGSSDECLQALAEYAVWCEMPNEADTDLVREAVIRFAEYIPAEDKNDFQASSLPWARLLPI